MKILITGAQGFIGKNIVQDLLAIQAGKKKSALQNIELLLFDKEDSIATLERYCRQCDFVVHLAGVNRPKDASEFAEGNTGLTELLVSYLEKHQNYAPVLLSSSIQANLDNPYGQSKKQAEEVLLQYAQKHTTKVYIYRFPNVFGKWCKPNYNSVVATFCHNIARDIPIQINNSNAELTLVYIDDVIEEIENAILGNANMVNGNCAVKTTHKVTVGQIAELLYSFQNSRVTLSVPNLADSFQKKLHATYLSYIDVHNLAYPLKMNVDVRGSFTEIIRTQNCGQFSVNISKPGITKGNHWHHTKNEKFLVVNGKGIIRFRKLGEEEVVEYPVSGEVMQVIDIPVGYTHNIENTGEQDLVTFMWCNECFDPQRPDTYFEEI